ncbi:hypothetical protein CK203_009673 [Vitis vinifera]|uniref:Uncharacterized protein n=1 Tax=Vitis vinifera TaxID=29760 RepID=A0A438JS53_VITVI|nr:hypothetical protein CK203_009673 [Vitis vinifera]
MVLRRYQMTMGISHASLVGLLFGGSGYLMHTQRFLQSPNYLQAKGEGKGGWNSNINMEEIDLRTTLVGRGGDPLLW